METEITEPIVREIKPSWATRMVVRWCLQRTFNATDRKLLTRCRTAYRAGPMVGPVKRYADVLEQQIRATEQAFRDLQQELLAEADRQDHEYLKAQRD